MSLQNKKILVTCGPTWVPIDGVRVLSNVSTGVLGQMIAAGLAKKKASVTLLEGPVVNPLNLNSIKVKRFSFYSEFYKLFKSELAQKHDVVIHAAAISDYQLAKIFSSKLSSDLRHVSLKLKPTVKLINRIKKINPKTFLVGFKLESRLSSVSSIEKTKKLFSKARCDLVVANTATKHNYKGFILNNKKKIVSKANSRKDIANKLIKNLNALI